MLLSLIKIIFKEANRLMRLIIRY